MIEKRVLQWTRNSLQFSNIFKQYFFAVDLILLLKIKGACVHPGGCLNMVFVILGVGCLVSRIHQFVSRVGCLVSRVWCLVSDVLCLVSRGSCITFRSVSCLVSRISCLVCRDSYLVCRV